MLQVITKMAMNADAAADPVAALRPMRNLVRLLVAADLGAS
jgi:hypothetical protein